MMYPVLTSSGEGQDKNYLVFWPSQTFLEVIFAGASQASLHFISFVASSGKWVKKWLTDLLFV